MSHYRLPALAGAALLSQMAPAFALDFNWSFIADSSAGTPPVLPITTVSGTISGLVEGGLNQTAVTITVNSPSVVGGFTFGSGDGFDVVGGVVTGSNAVYTSGSYTLFFGDNTGFFPEFSYLGNPFFSLFNEGATTTFSAIESTSIPEPAAIGILTVGLAGLAASRRRRRNS